MKLSWWWIIDRVEYGIAAAKLAIGDMMCGPQPATWADQRREREHQRLQKAFPGVDTDYRRPKR
jgi:hypothetical protein